MALWRVSRHVPSGRDPGTDPELSAGIMCPLSWKFFGIPQEELESVALKKDVTPVE